MRSDAVRGHLDLLVLSVLADQPLYGYGLIEELRTRSRGEFDLPEGTVYPALHRLERSRCLVSEWVIGPSGRRQRRYRLTPRGQVALQEERNHWNRLKAAVAWTIAGAGSKA